MISLQCALTEGQKIIKQVREPWGDVGTIACICWYCRDRPPRYCRVVKTQSLQSFFCHFFLLCNNFQISRNAMLAVYLWHPSSSSAGTHTLSTIPALAGSDICIPLLPRHSIIITVSFQTFCTRKEMKYKFMKLSEHFKILFPRGWGGCQYVFAHYKNGRFLARHPITFFLMCHVFYIMQM